jgi:hypothetical protein
MDTAQLTLVRQQFDDPNFVFELSTTVLERCISGTSDISRFFSVRETIENPPTAAQIASHATAPKSSVRPGVDTKAREVSFFHQAGAKN